MNSCRRTSASWPTRPPSAIGQGQTISQPYIVAFMTEAFATHGPREVLEIGTGSGYQAAVLAELGPRSIPRDPLRAGKIRPRQPGPAGLSTGEDALRPTATGWPERAA